jgi:hypothetical protein
MSQISQDNALEEPYLHFEDAARPQTKRDNE